MYQLDYQLTKDDFIEFNMYHADHSKTIRKSLILQRFLFPLIILGFPFIVNKGSDMIFLTIYSILAILWVIFYPRFFFKSMKKKILKMVNEGKNHNLFGDYRLEITSESIIENTKHGRQERKWSAVSLVAETENCILIYVSSLEALIVPKRAFDSSREIHDFVRFCSQNISNN